MCIFFRYRSICVPVCVCSYVHMSAGAQGGQRMTLDSLVLELRYVNAGN